MLVAFGIQFFLLMFFSSKRKSFHILVMPLGSTYGEQSTSTSRIQHDQAVERGAEHEELCAFLTQSFESWESSDKLRMKYAVTQA